MKSRSPSSQSGNVLFIILLAIALFGALSFAVSNSLQSDTAGIMNERDAKLAAADILNYTQVIQRAVDRVRSKGCSENDISFENTTVSGYAHTPDVEDKCKIFNPSGGSANWQSPANGVNDGTEWFIGVNAIRTFNNLNQLGTEGTELTLLLPRVDRVLCDHLNDISNGLNIRESGGTHNQLDKFTGDFSSALPGINRGNSWPVPETGCFCDGIGACQDSFPRFFYYTLLVR